MVGKKALAVSVTLIVLAACAKNGILFKRPAVRVAEPKPVEKVVHVYDHPKKPVAAKVAASGSTTDAGAASDRVQVAVARAKPPATETGPSVRPKPRRKGLNLRKLASRIFKTKRPAARPADLVPAHARAKPAPAVVARRKPAVKTQPQAVAVAARPQASIKTTLIDAKDCRGIGARSMPSRRPGALAGSKVVKRAMAMGGSDRDRYLVRQLLAGNMPRFLRSLTPVVFRGRDARGRSVRVTVCVTPDYLAVGSDRDYVRVPLGLPAAATVANKLGFVLPTTKIVDAIYSQAGLRLKPQPMQPGKQMTSTTYLWLHNKTVQSQLVAAHRSSAVLVAGQKKDLVLSNSLKRSPHRVAIYGWHRGNGAPIQPLSTVHGEQYADYSHGIRLVNRTAFVDGKPYPLAKLLEDPVMSRIVSKEGPIHSPLRLMAAVSR